MGHNLLAKIYIGQGRFAKAEGHLRKALELEQGSWEALIQLLFVLHRTGQLPPQGAGGAGGAGGDVSQAICERIRALLRQQGVREEPEALGLCAFFDPALWQRPLRADASVAARMRAHKYVALAEILPLDTVRALQAYYRKIIRTQYKACVCTHVYVCVHTGWRALHVYVHRPTTARSSRPSTGCCAPPPRVGAVTRWARQLQAGVGSRV